jgi:hypothetical protein
MLAIAKALSVVNRLRDEGIISAYAVGGAVGALFYIEPTQTQDIDIFVHLHPAAGSMLVTIAPILERLKGMGFALWEEDKVVVEGWPIQFLPATKPIEIEAIELATQQPVVDGVEASVPLPEYLMAIAIDLGRPKDLVRLQSFHEQAAYDEAELSTLLGRFGLQGKWKKLSARFDPRENS